MVYLEPKDIDELSTNTYFVISVIDIKTIARKNAGWFFLMIFISVVFLFLSTFFIDRDTNKLIIDPMQEMMKKIKGIQKNPVLASKLAEEE